MDEISPMPLAPKAGPFIRLSIMTGTTSGVLVRPEKAEGTQFGQGSALLKGEALRKGVAKTHNYSAFYLPFQSLWIDRRSDVMGRHDSFYSSVIVELNDLGGVAVGDVAYGVLLRRAHFVRHSRVFAVKLPAVQS